MIEHAHSSFEKKVDTVSSTPFVHLHLHSPYSFLDGASSISAYLERAAQWGMPALALTDHHNLSGAVEFQKTAKKLGIRPILGAEISLAKHHITLLAENNLGYENLCRLLTRALAKDRHNPDLTWDELAPHTQGLIALSGCRRSLVNRLLLLRQPDAARDALEKLKAYFGPRQVYIEMIHSYLPQNRYLLEGLQVLSEQTNTPTAATNNVHYLAKEDFPIHDLLTCVRTKTTLEDLHPERSMNGENYFASTAEMQQRFARYPQALQGTWEIAQRCQESLPLDRSLFPRFSHPDMNGQTAGGFLEDLVWQGARNRYGNLNQTIRQRLQHELHIIRSLDVADYFLAVWDIVQFAKGRGIAWAGRGSAADSAAAYCLELTNVDAIGRNLLFERFLSLERSQTPDIDIDFDAGRRDEVADYVYRRYGQDYTASVCTFSTYHARSALRDFGRALGLNSAELRAITAHIPHAPADALPHVLQSMPELRQHPLQHPKYQRLVHLCAAINGFPRHIGTHLGGMVICGRPLWSVSPLQPSAKGVAILQFDKDTIEDLGLIKLDLLSLRTLAAVQQVEQGFLQAPNGTSPVVYDDPATYAMLQRGDTVGVFQLESPAQRSLQGRLHSETMEDIIASVALIRPGPIQGDMVHPFIRRRRGEEPASYIHPKLEPILKKTYGVVLYQEQVIAIATEIAGFTPGEADRLRRVMSKFRSHHEMEAIGTLFRQRAAEQGIDDATAAEIFSYIQGYAGYGFCEAHAAAFADTAYKTAYLLEHHPAQFYAALLNHQPMGFYPPNTLCLQARLRGVTIQPLDIAKSEAICSAGGGWLRIGLNQVRGLTDHQRQDILTQREQQPFTSLGDFIHRTALHQDNVEALVLAGAFDRFSTNRRSLLWDCTRHIKERRSALVMEEPAIHHTIEDFPALERWVREYQALGLSANGHILDFYRSQLQKQGALTGAEIRAGKQQRVRTAGLVIRPHRPPTRSGRVVVFLTLEDETGLMDATIFESVYHRYAQVIFHHPLLVVEGSVLRDGAAVSVTADRIWPLKL